MLRAAEACALLRLLSAHNLGRLALRQLGGSGAADMARLTNLVGSTTWQAVALHGAQEP